MGYQRAEWRSGLRYKQTCIQCNTTIIYMDDKLDFRPWFPEGFVYCPTCKKPLRHNEAYAMDRPQPKTVEMCKTPTPNANPQGANPQGANPQGRFGFCSQCGHPFTEGARFCSQCGARKPN